MTTLAVYDYTPRDLAQLDPDRRVIIGYLAQFRTDATQRAYQTFGVKHARMSVRPTGAATPIGL